MKYLFLNLFLLASPSLFSQNILSSEYSLQQNIAFIENKGQITDQYQNKRDDIKFLLDANGFKLHLKQNSFTYELYTTENAPNTASEATGKPENVSKLSSKKIKTITTDVFLIGANPEPTIIAEEKSTDYLNYIINGEEIYDIHHFKKITYQNIYPNIDLVFSYAKGKLKYDFVVRKGGNPAQIAFKYGGLVVVSSKKNQLLLNNALGTITESAPIVFTADSKPVKAAWNYENGTASFILGNYDKNQTLIIDPTLDWATYYGAEFVNSPLSTGVDDFKGITSDNKGDVYVTGETTSASNIATTGALVTIYSGEKNALIAKFLANGTRRWATYFGQGLSGATTGGSSIAIDKATNGSIYVAGYGVRYDGVVPNRFPNLVKGATQQTTVAGSGYKAFLSKFDTSGTWTWGTLCAGSGLPEWTLANAVQTDLIGNVYIAGETNSATNIATAGAYKTTLSGAAGVEKDGFLVKYNTNGIREWGTYLGGLNGSDIVRSIATDKDNNVYITGETSSFTGISTAGAHKVNKQPDIPDIVAQVPAVLDAFLMKFNSTGTIQWGTYFGGNGDDIGLGVGTDGNNDVYISGYTRSAKQIAKGTVHKDTLSYLSLTDSGYAYTDDAFVAKFNTNGVQQWGSYLGGTSFERVYGFYVSASGKTYLTGDAYSSEQVAIANGKIIPQTTKDPSNADAFLAVFNPSGTLSWSSYLGGNSYDAGNSVTVSASNIYIAGITKSTSGISKNAHQSTYGGGSSDGWLLRVADDPYCSTSSKDTLVGICGGSFITLTSPSNGTYLWSNGATTKSINVSAPGSYSVETTLAGGCVNNDVFNVSFASVTGTVKQNAIWYFGNGAGLDFNSGTPVVITNGATNTSGLTSAVSDANGNLLFYAEPGNIYNKNHQIMQNGGGLNSDGQATIIVPHPTNPNVYYTFFQRTLSGMQVGLVNITANSGAGSVNVLNLDAPNTVNLGIKMAATKGTGFAFMWVVTHSAVLNQFRAYRVSTSGQVTGPTFVITSNVSSAIGNANNGQIRFSQDGTKLAYVSQGNDTVYVFPFNAATGQVGNATTKLLHGGGTNLSCEFSPDGTKLYVTNSNGQDLIQYDLANGNAKTQINLPAEPSVYYDRMSLAPDGKIYVSLGKAGLGYLGVINNPNSAGLAANYQHRAVNLQGKTTNMSMPIFVNNYYTPTPSIPITYTIKDSCEGAPTNFTVSGSNVISCKWDFGVTGITSDTSNAKIAAFTYPASGNYTVTLTVKTPCGDSVYTKNIKISPTPVVNLGADIVTCNPQVIVDAGNFAGATYLWNDGSTSRFDTIASRGNFSVAVTQNGCTGRDTVNIKFTWLFTTHQNNWLFGDGCWAEFNTTGNYQNTTKSANTNGGIEKIPSSFSNTNGKLRIWTDAETIGSYDYATQNATAYTGNGNISSTSNLGATLVMPLSDTSNFIVFYTAGANGLRTNNVNVTTNIVNAPINRTPSKTVTKHLAGMYDGTSNYWVVTHQFFTNTFIALQYDKFGTFLQTVETPIGKTASANNGVLRFSPDGKKIAMTGIEGNFGFLQWFDFNPTTGVLSNPQIIIFPLSFIPYGVEFSPDNSKIYVTDRNIAVSPSLSRLIQVDLQKSNQQTVLSTLIGGGGLQPSFSALLLASDNRIYVAHQGIGGWDSLGVIYNPNLSGASARFVDKVYYVSNGTSSGQLPQFFANYVPIQILDFSYKDTCNGSPTTFSTDYISTSYKWDFGDGSPTVSGPSAVTHTYTTSGVKTVKLTVTDVCNKDTTLTKNITVNDFPVFDLGADKIVCGADSVVLDAGVTGAGITYLWNNALTTQKITAKTSGKYYVTVAQGSCAATDSINVTLPTVSTVNKRDNNWYFGLNAGISFASGAAVVVSDGRNDAISGTASISDANGNLLFYSNGINIWDKSHNIMPNGFGVGGSPGATQNSLFVSHPTNANLYYLVVNSGTELRYNLIDITLNGGKGDVISGNKNILLANNTVEKLAGVTDNKGTIWAVTHERNSNRFVAFKINNTGLSTTPVFSAVGKNYGAASAGELKFSHNGKKAAIADQSGNTIEIFDFDFTTGIFSNPLQITNIKSPYGLEFSPNNTFLYTTHSEGFSDATNGDKIYQFDISSANAAIIMASRTEIAHYIGESVQLGGLKLAPDGKIYIALFKVSANRLSLINSPNNKGVAANHIYKAINLSVGAEGSKGLPNSVAGYAESIEPDFSYLDTCTAGLAKFTMIQPSGFNYTKFSWDFGTGNAADTSNAQNPTFTFNTANTYAVKLTASDGCIVKSVTKNIIILPSFTPTLKIDYPTNDTVCYNTNVTYKLKNVSGSPFTYQWYVDDVAQSGKTDSLWVTTHSALNRREIKVIAKPTRACATVKEVIDSVFVNVIPIASGNSSGGFSIDKNPICVGEQVTFTTKPQNFVRTPTLMWFVNDTLKLVKQGENPPLDYQYSTTTLKNNDKVKVWITSSYKCLQTDTVKENAITVTVNQPQNPTVTLSTTSNPICAGENAVFKASGTLKGTAPTFQWKINGVDSGAPTTDSSFTSTTINNNDVVSVLMKSNNTCVLKDTVTSNGITMTVQSSFVPTATILADKTELCQGQIFRFEVKEVTGGGTNPTYQWRRNSTNITNETNINLSTSTLATNDTISVEVTSSATCAVPRKAISNKIVVKVNTVAMGNASGGFNASKNPICVGEEVTFTTKPQNFVTNPIMMWFVNDVLVLNKEALSPADYSYASNSLNNGDKVKVWITSSYKCLQTDTVKENAITVTVNQPQNPTVNISTTNNPICAGESAVFKASGTLKGTAPTFQWKVNGANSGASTTDSTITISSLSNGSIVTVQMRSNATCLTKDTVTSPPVVMTVEASVVPAIQIIADATTRCSGEVFNFQVAGIGGGGTNPTYQWTRNGTVIPNQTSDKLSISNLANNDTIRGVIISSAVCAAPPTTTSNPIVVQVNQTPPAINLAGNSPKIIGCQGEVVTLDATSPLTGATYLWNTGATSNAINVNFSGIYYVTVTSPIGNCKTTDTVEVELLTKPIVNLAADQTICEGDTAVLDAGANASYTYQWSNGATTPKITVKDGGTYKVRVRIGNSATCEAQAEQKVNIAPNPTVALEPQYTFCADELPGIAVEAKSTDAVSYLWSTGENTPTIFVTKPETLSLTAKNAQGCITNITTSVMNECKPVLIVPNAFTPNNDIKNDYFQVYGRNIGAFEIYIFNRWGEQIFYSNDINEKWWGKYLGAPVPTGLYVYKIKYKGSLPNSKEETLQGEIQVLR